MTSPEPTGSTRDAERRPSIGGGTIAEEIAAVNARFMEAFRAGDAEATTACYTPDAALLPAGSDVVSGAEAISSFWRGGMASGIAAVRLETAEILPAGDLAVEVGRYDLAGADGGSIDHGKYLVVWRRVGGTWRLHRDIWTTSVPTQAS